MPCLNPGPFLDEALASCLAQPELLQLLVADGGSDEATLACLEAWGRRDPRLIWWTRADSGPADALNQALARAEASLIGWINADDRYEPGALERAVAALEQHPNWQMVYGHGQHIDAEGAFLELYPTRAPEAGIEAFQDGCFICQPTVVLRRSFLEQLGGLDPRWQTCFDLDLWLRAFATAPQAIGCVPALQASTRLHDNTITAQQQWRVNLESAALLQRSCGVCSDHWFHTAARDWISRARPVVDPEVELAAAGFSQAEELLPGLQAALQQLQGGGAASLAMADWPTELQLLLQSRPDLVACGFHRPEQQPALAQWLLLHGLREYPAFGDGDAKRNPVLAWLAQKPEGSELPRLAQAIWDSTARHQRRWPLPRRATAYQRWLRRHWRRLPQQPLPDHAALFGAGRLRRWLERWWPRHGPDPRQGAAAIEPGVTLIGYASHALGIGEDLRTTASALQHVGVPISVVDFPPSGLPGRTLHAELELAAALPQRRVVLVCLTAEETIRYVLSQGRALLQHSHVIGYWPWELPHWPQPWRPAFDLVDEIWVSSRHTQAAVANQTTKPVQLMPLCVDAQLLQLRCFTPEQRLLQRRLWALPEEATVALCSFDLSSSSQRKNPWGAIQAFQRAFPPALAGGRRNDVALVVKTFRPPQPHRDWEQLKRLAALDPRIHILEANLSRPELSALYGCCDVLLSLHRAEGFGRVLAEALQLGLDVIATDWSGNADFCHGPLAHPVPYSLVPVSVGAYPHWPDQHWAEPDLGAAARIFRQVVEQRRLRGAAVAAELAAPHRQRFSALTCGQRFRQRLEQLGALSAPRERSCAAPGSNLPPPG
jgi:glycosyltransferase involved in cell wall biosynthesis